MQNTAIIYVTKWESGFGDTICQSINREDTIERRREQEKERERKKKEREETKHGLISDDSQSIWPIRRFAACNVPLNCLTNGMKWNPLFREALEYIRSNTHFFRNLRTDDTQSTFIFKYIYENWQIIFHRGGFRQFSYVSSFPWHF